MNTYTLAIDGTHGVTDLALPLMTMVQAKAARETLAKLGKTGILIRNTAAE
jgi:hypothetical protein